MSSVGPTMSSTQKFSINTSLHSFLTFYFFFLPLIAVPLHPYSPTLQQPRLHSPCALAPLRPQPLRDQPLRAQPLRTQPLRACSPARLLPCMPAYLTMFSSTNLNVN
ncbi:hypothetical protein ACOSQ3_004120 [Xanthoceras sorbifolium]